MENSIQNCRKLVLDVYHSRKLASQLLREDGKRLPSSSRCLAIALLMRAIARTQNVSRCLIAMAKLTQLEVAYISLVDKPATGKPIQLKNGEVGSVFEMLKTDDENQLVYGIVYAPDQLDSQGDYADAETIRKAAYDFLHKHRTGQVDTQHNFQTNGSYVVESWITRGKDPQFPDEPEGSWAVGIQVTSDKVWTSLKAGKLAGLSLAGFSKREKNEPHMTWKQVQDFLKGLMPATQQEPTMNEQQVRDLVKSEVTEAITAALKDAGVDKEQSAPTEEAKNSEAAKEPESKRSEKSVTEQIAESFTALEKQIDTKVSEAVAKATAKGQTETSTNQTAPESF